MKKSILFPVLSFFLIGCSVDNDELDLDKDQSLHLSVNLQAEDLCGFVMTHDFDDYGQLGTSVSDGVLSVTVTSYDDYFIENVKLHIAGIEGFPTVGKGNLPPGQMAINKGFDTATDQHTFTFDLDEFELSQNENGNYYLSIASQTTFEQETGGKSFKSWAGDQSGNRGNWFFFNYDLEVCCEMEMSAGQDKTVRVNLENFNPKDIYAKNIKRFFEENILDPDATTGGTFSPSFFGESGLGTQFYDGVRELTTVYTVGEGSCEDSAILSLIIEESSESEENFIE